MGDPSRGCALLAIAGHLDRSCSVGAFSRWPRVSGWAPCPAIAVGGMAFSRSLAIWTIHRFTRSPEVAALSVTFLCGRRSLDGLLGQRSLPEGVTKASCVGLATHPSPTTGAFLAVV